MHMVIVIGWATLGAMFGAVAAWFSCECVWKLLDKGKWQRLKPCGPAHGVAIMWINPALCAFAWTYAPPNVQFNTCTVLTLIATAVSTMFACLCASD